MGAIKNQKPGLKNPERLYARYSGVPVVYVESDEDHYVFGECWFQTQAARIEFRPVSRRDFAGETTAGCHAVIEAVRDERLAGNPAWGIVDRDALFSQCCWNLVHEIDDEAFAHAAPFGSHVKVLLRWEMESYLIDAAAIEKYLGERQLRVPRSNEEGWVDLMADCLALIPHAALNAVRHELNEKGLGDGRTDAMSDRTAVEEQLIEKDLTSLERRHGACRQRYAHFLQAAEYFDRPDGAPRERVISMLRRIHGKAVLSRIQSRHRTGDIKGHLAASIRALNRVPDELHEFVDRVIRDEK